MTAVNYEWSSERMTQPRATRIIGADAVATLYAQMTTQISTLAEKIDALGSHSFQNAYYHQQPGTDPNYYNPGLHDHQDFSWRYNNQDQFYTPSLSHPSEFSYQHPLQQDDTSNLEDLVTKVITECEERRIEGLLSSFMVQIKVQMCVQTVAIRNLEDKVQQLADAIINCPQSTIPSNTEINSKEEGKEKCTVELQGSGEEFHETFGGNLKRVHLDIDDDSEIGKKMSMNGFDDRVVEDHAVVFKSFKVIAYPSDLQVCFRVDLVKDALKDKADEESFFLPMDEVKFGGCSLCKTVMQNKEKTKRRHAVTNFAIEPD